MVTKVTMWQASDGSVFPTEKKARDYDSSAAVVLRAKRLLLPEEFDTTSFANGSGYIQVEPRDVVQFLGLFRQAIQDLGESARAAFELNPRGVVGRFLCDSKHPAYTLWITLHSLDSKNRLWGQPFFVNNPMQAKQVRLNK